MDAETISKNAASPKSLMSRENFFIITVLAFVLGSLALTSCNEEEETPSLYGTWVCIEATEYGKYMTFSESAEVDKTAFYKDGTCYLYAAEAAGIWSYDNGILKVTSLITVDYTVKKLTSSTMQLELEYDGYTHSYTYKKL